MKSELQWKGKERSQGEDFLKAEVVLDEDLDAQAEVDHLDEEDMEEIETKEDDEENEVLEVDHLLQD
jgi:hypothetical protein